MFAVEGRFPRSMRSSSHDVRNSATVIVWWPFHRPDVTSVRAAARAFCASAFDGKPILRGC